MNNIKLLMGNEAAALGAVRAGVTVACGYPGTPSTEAMEYIAKNYGHEIHAEWSINEKSALEVAAGASYSGARTFVTMKQVGLNVAADPIMSLRYVGITGGMVVYVADDPGPISSQTEQDTRTFGMFSKIPVFDPSSPEEAFFMMEAAYSVSERYQTPVIFRPTTRVCHANAAIDTGAVEQLPRAAGAFPRDGRRVIFPRTSYLAHRDIEDKCEKLSGEFSASRFNRTAFEGAGRKGIIAGGVSWAYMREAMDMLGISAPILKISTPYPFPDRLALDFMRGLDEVLIFEELDPFIEREIMRVCGLHGVSIRIRGKHDSFTPRAGENSTDIAADCLAKYLGMAREKKLEENAINLPIRPPVLCAGCPHRASFYAVKRAMKGKKAIFAGDIGCYTLGNAKPLDMVDTCLCMGAGITVAQGIWRAEPDVVPFSFTGDSTFFHTGLPGIANAVYNKARLIAVILDNSTTAMTGHQPNPSTGFSANGEVAGKIDIAAVLTALGVSSVRTVDPLDLNAAVDAVRQAANESGVSAIIFKSPCIAVAKPKKALAIDPEKCADCMSCAREIGCPAIIKGADGRLTVDSGSCFGCGLCARICPTGAIGGAENE